MNLGKWSSGITRAAQAPGQEEQKNPVFLAIPEGDSVDYARAVRKSNFDYRRRRVEHVGAKKELILKPSCVLVRTPSEHEISGGFAPKKGSFR